MGLNKVDVAEVSPCGRYCRYKKVIGRGAFKDVYKGFDLVDNVEIAWNQIYLDGDVTLNSLENQETSAYSEAVLLRSLDHERIMKCYSCWVDRHNRCVCIITEFFNHCSLRQYTKSLGGVNVETIKNWGRQILQGLHYLHTRIPRIMHRDMKCDNIFVNVDNNGGITIKIGDFGLATAMEQSTVSVLAGTPEFMAPEFYDEEYNELVDVYAFGMCLLELATCECPYSECTNAAQIFKKVSSGIKPAALGRVTDSELKAMIEKCLLPASLRPSAGDLLKDPYFSSGTPMEEGNFGSRSNSMLSSGTDSCLTIEETICGGGRDDLGLKSFNMDDSILSGISALYNSMSLPDDRNLLRVYHHSLVDDDASMKSRITSASLSGAVSNFWYSSESKPAL